MADQPDENADEDVFELTKMVGSINLNSSRISQRQDHFDLDQGLSILRGEFEEFSNGETHLLYRIFEELSSVKNETSDTALWHAFDETKLNSFSVQPLQRASSSSECVSTTTALESSTVKTITFYELNNRANQIARILRRSLKDHGANIGPESLRDAELLYKTPNWLYERTQAINELENLQQKTIIAIFMPPGIDRVVTQIACMKLHLAYLPLDRQQPASKIIELIESVRPISVIIDSDYFENADDLLVGYAQDQAMASQTNNLGAYLEQNRKRTTGLSSQLRGDLVSRARLMEVISEFGVLFYDSLCSVAQDLKISEANLSTTAPDAKGQIFTECLFPAVPDPMLLLLFSSGTTSNQQKGVRLSNKQMYNRLKWQWSCQEVGPCGQMDMSISSYDLSSNSFEIGLCKTAWLFVDSFTELFSMILVGLPCVLCGNSSVPSEAITADVCKFAHLCFQFQITRVNVVPAVLKSWLCQIEASAKNELDSLLNQLSSLTTVVCSGDTLSSHLAKKFFQVLKQRPEYPNKVLVNLYGSTEVAGDISYCVYHNLEEVYQMTTSELEGKATQSYLSIGAPISNVEMYIVCPIRDLKRSDSKSNDDLELEEFEDREEPFRSSRLKVCPKGTVGEIAVAGLAICQKFHTYWGHKLNDDHSVPTSRKISEVLRSPVMTRSSGIFNFAAPNKERKISPHSPIQKTPFVFNNIRISKPEFERLYLTGDRGFISSRDNKLFIIGRSDDMIKVNGVLCNASSVDLLIAEASAKSPEFSCIETSKTIGVQVPGNKNRLVCFYTLKNTTIESCLPNVDSNDNRVLGLPIGTTCENKFRAAMLAELVNNHLSVFITPVFIQLDHMPYQRVSGKVDKARLRTFYLSRACELANIPPSTTRHSFFNRNKRDSLANVRARGNRPRSASFDFLSPITMKNKQEIGQLR
ncbi:hypothetical protein Ciccas_005368 [Cichlidogyrus casuarinus]|uniref:AMP-dependent synthetase/ligase domain-containing protein n=1 Tax=Cichlidogyrus casuarinus TaxID=1844966 RepID=A0ABD2QCF6_9PLAT